MATTSMPPEKGQAAVRNGAHWSEERAADGIALGVEELHARASGQVDVGEYDAESGHRRGGVPGMEKNPSVIVLSSGTKSRLGLKVEKAVTPI